MSPEKDLDPSKIAKVEVVFWNQTRAEEKGFPNILPEGEFRAVFAIAQDASGKILGKPKIFKGVDGFRLPMDEVYKKEKINEARVLFGLEPEP